MERKRSTKGFHFYPVKRKKKRKHTQFMDWDRVLVDWKFVPRMYYVFAIPEKGWWVCLPDKNFYGNIEVQGYYYRPVMQLPFYEFGSGDMVYGYVGVISHRHKAIHEGRFVFVKNVMNAGRELSQVLAYKYKVHLEKYKEVYLWMEQ